jgi:hypothetical protein
MIDINKAFEGRWRYMSESIIAHHQEEKPITHEVLRRLCHDFFEAGFLIGSNHTEGSEGPLCGDAVSAITPPDFDTFWNTYNKKVGREKCLKLWAKLSAKDKAECLSYIPLYVKAQPDKQYRKNPETFLRNKSWHDEIINRTTKPTAADLASKAARILQG